MTESMIEAVRVRIVGSDEPLRVTSQPEVKPGRRTNLRTFAISAGDDAVLLVPSAPKRRNTVLTITGTAGNSAFLCGSMADAQAFSGAIVLVGQMVPLTGTSEIWAVTANEVAIGVFAEYDE